jgi:hypothetical protein
MGISYKIAAFPKAELWGKSLISINLNQFSQGNNYSSK